MDCREAFEAVGRGHTVYPADAESAEWVAERLDKKGNDTRAAMIRRWAAKEFGAPAAAAELVPAVASAPIAPTTPQGPSVEEANAEVRRLVEAAGDDVAKLEIIGRRAGIERVQNPTPKKLRHAIYTAAARNVSAGKPPLGT